MKLKGRQFLFALERHSLPYHYSDRYNRKTCMMDQWLRFQTANAESIGLAPGQETKIRHAMWHGIAKKLN